jgi:hypothetical protein
MRAHRLGGFLPRWFIAAKTYCDAPTSENDVAMTPVATCHGTVRWRVLEWWPCMCSIVRVIGPEATVARKVAPWLV